MNLFTDSYWCPVKDADPRVISMYERHYSASPTKRGHHKSGIAGPAERMVLMTTDSLALWVWRLVLAPNERVSSMTHPDNRRKRKGLTLGEASSTYFGTQTGVMCSIFRNEGPLLSSDLVSDAEGWAWARWPGRRLFTYVWPSKIRSVNPGYCFKIVGWQDVGTNKDGRLRILEKWPVESLDAELANKEKQ